MAVPLAVLRDGDIKFLPNLSIEKRISLNKMGAGVMDKLIIEFESVFWDTETDWLNYVDETPDILWPKTFNLFKHTGNPILVMHTFGEGAAILAEMSDEEILQSGLDVIKKMYPDATNVVSSHRTDWGNDQLSKMTHAFMKENTTPTDVKRA